MVPLTLLKTKTDSTADLLFGYFQGGGKIYACENHAHEGKAVPRESSARQEPTVC